MTHQRFTTEVLKALRTWGPILLGVMFLVAGTSKMIDPWSFHAALPGYGISGAMRLPVALVVPMLEVVLGAALVVRWRPRVASLCAGAFLALFIVVICIGWWRGTLEECGCFGAMLKRSPAEAAAIDALFLVLAAAVWHLSPRVREEPRLRLRLAILAGIGICALISTLAHLQVGPSGLQATEGGDPSPELRSVDLGEGEHLLYLFHHECPQCAQMSPIVAGYDQDPSLPPVVGFTLLSTQSQIDEYRDRYELRMPARSLPRKQFARITGDGSVPQLVFVRDGKILRVWSIVLPDATELRAWLAKDQPE